MDKPNRESHVDWRADPYWRQRRISPAQLLVQDIRLEGWRQDAGPMLEIKEVLSSSLLPDLMERDRLRKEADVSRWVQNRSEQYHFKSLVAEYGWLNVLRNSGVQKSVGDPEGWRKCRWIHISSKFSEYLEGCLLGFSDWSINPARVIAAFRKMELCIYQNERFSKHGRYFSPFVQRLVPDDDPDNRADGDYPMLISVPFLDWTVGGETPPLRFQVDPREGFQSSRGSSHMLRSLLQYFYRLEDTTDREHNQVFTKHRPWINDRDLDLKVRSLYGHYPCGLNVDELWILVIDARHIVTFSSNQSWKSRWPPLQLASRIAEVSFRGIRNSFFRSEQNPDFTAMTHAVACLSGAVGMLHRSFWSDLKLCLVDRYAGYLGHLQYRLHRSPSTRLVMDLLQVQEELNIIIQMTEQQLDIISRLQDILETHEPIISEHMSIKSRPRSRGIPERRHGLPAEDSTLPPFFRATYRQLSSSSLEHPVSQLLENLQREYVDLCDLRDNSNNLLNRTIQLVNMRLEDHGKAILVFTIVTVIFLPLSFVTSFFGMNFSDIRDMDQTQRLFWIVAASVTVGVVGLASFLAFYGGEIVEAFMDWRESRAARRRTKLPKVRRRNRPTGATSFEVLDVSGPASHYS
ncbi:Mg2+ transporter protein CorA-like/Zinc transport protein ZntB [Macrophomina phaseolina MS6]|uniref:Mg2+ transporter protein CorA-like/Zinc transport protein ZntB n=1 Tax=Macrophomina phaseolina (strain MS6) TaxID=1126212 RepID=K2RWA1_MACPH|nr:Mg2+ transporter protein CorA-like/Zinc transport protein ZntB [Macrophomina phaseolina MS6]